MRGREREEVCYYPAESTPSNVLIGSFRRFTFTELTTDPGLKKRRDVKPLVDFSS
jgi:hypothetical protein